MAVELPLPKLQFLDVRPEAEASANPIVGAVHIPLNELANRMFELPGKRELIRLVGRSSEEGMEFLQARGRSVVVETSFEYGPQSPGRLWAPNPYLLASVKDLRPGRALDLACGSGRDAVALALLGWEVTAIDHLADAIENGQRLAERSGVKVQWKVADLRQEAVEVGQFDLMTCFFWWNADLVQQSVEALAPGGTLLLETFGPKHRERFGKPASEQLVLNPEKVRTLFPGAAVQEVESDGRFVCRVQWKKQSGPKA